PGWPPRLFLSTRETAKAFPLKPHLESDIIEAKLTAQPSQIQIGPQMDHFESRHLAEILPLVSRDCLAKGGMMPAPCFQPTLSAALEIRPRNPDSARGRKLGH